MTSVQLPTKATLSATLLLVLILGSVLCPPCKARQLMQTPEERIDALCDNIEIKLNNIENKLKITYDTQLFISPLFRTISISRFTNAGNLKDEVVRKFARLCGFELYGK